MSRWWTEFVAGLADVTFGGIVGLALAVFLAALGTALLWYFWPIRLGWFARRGGRRDGRDRGRFRWPRWARLRWRWPRFRWPWRRRRKLSVERVLERLADDELPDLPSEVLALTADELAAAGRFAEAVRERLRAIVRELVERGVIEPRPGWTVTELAGHAIRARPVTEPGLRSATTTFSDIWYGLRPATVDDDVRMREAARVVHEALELSGAGVR